jgi:hypothetical protein
MDLKDKFNININEDGAVLELKKAQVVISNEMLVEEEDMPIQISKMLPGIQYLIECNLEPYTEDKKSISELMKLAKHIAQNGHGVIENPQTEEIILPSGVKRVQEFEKTERISVINLSWWFNHNKFIERDNLINLMKEIERNIPEALPKRYGLYEPPKEKFENVDSFISFLMENMEDSVVWYPSKPVLDVSFSIPKPIGPNWMGYRFGRFSIGIDSAVLSLPGWKTSIERLFKNLSEIIQPFYGDIYLIKNYIRGRNVLWSDGETEEHPIVSWWWNGIPRKLGLGIIVGEPLTDFVKFEQDCLVLNNGCKLLIQKEFMSEYELFKRIKIEDGILQPEIKQNPKFKVHGFSGMYPKTWPFEGPKQAK